MNEKTRLPKSTQRIAIIGRTGSGKTVAGLWHLSNANFSVKPWIVFDYKTDEHINSIEGAEHIDLSFIPKKKGIYIVHPLPSQESEVTDYLWKLWAKENIGIYIDEGYMLGNNPAFEGCLTQGRSKHIPMIVTQRPNWISRFVFSESDFYQIFHLNDKRDRKTVESFVPANLNLRLPDYHSYYYDVGRNSMVVFSAVPDAQKTVDKINEGLQPKKRIF